MSYKVTVIIPTYNAQEYIMDSVNSVISQSIGFENIELIIVDDNSSDNTKEILKELSKNHANIKSIFLNDNSGTASKPRNVGIDNASSDYIMFLDNDDIYYPDMCQKMYDAITSYDADAASCRYEINESVPYSFLNDFNPKDFKDFKGSYDEKNNIILLNSIDDFRDIMTLGHPTMIWTKIFRRSFVLENDIRFIEGDLYEDVYFSTKALLNAKGILILNNFFGYGYRLRMEGEDKSTCQVFSKPMLQKQLRGYLKTMKLLERENGKYDRLKGELTIDMTKIYMYAEIERECQNAFLNIMRPYYKDYKISTRVNTANLPFNIAINIFIKIFSLSNNLGIFIKDLFLKIQRN